MKPITCLMDYPTNEQVEIHPRVEGHLMDARAQGEPESRERNPGLLAHPTLDVYLPLSNLKFESIH